MSTLREDQERLNEAVTELGRTILRAFTTRKCKGGCGDPSPHDSHLTWLGKRRAGAGVTDVLDRLEQLADRPWVNLSRAEAVALVRVARAAQAVNDEVNEARSKDECGECPPTVAAREELDAALADLDSSPRRTA